MKNRHLLKAGILLLFASRAIGQSCPVGASTLTSYENTYYPASQASVSAGATSLTIGNANTGGYGTTPISKYDILLIIQMQGAQINSANSTSYGDGTGTGSGYLNNANLMAGQMEYVVANNAVPLTGGTLNLQSGLTHAYKNAGFGTDGQYSYQVIRVPLYFNLTLGANIRPPEWNGSVGGVIDLYVSGTLNMNGYSIDVSGTGFRGGGGKSYSNVGSGSSSDFVAPSSGKAGGSKGEGIAGTPIYLDSVNTLALITGTAEGYPAGSYDRGAPGNAGGGATDGLPSANSNNAGGGGGGNGGAGGIGGNSWSSNLPVGGRGGAVFAQQSPARLVLGGGGGAGSTDGGTGTPSFGVASSGAPGGGIVIITASSITGTGSVLANGAAPNTSLLNDGSGGGGAGGSILVITGTNSPGLTVNANGSAGASNTGAGAKHGPGGGGGGGIIYSNHTLAAVSVTGGAAGVTAGAVTYGDAAGATGISSQTVNITQIAHFPIICNGLLATQSLTASAFLKDKAIVIRWQAATEEEVDGYDVQRSTDSTGFVTIATFSPQEPATYTDLAAGNMSPLLYYRVRQRDVNGTIFYSNIAAIERLVSAPAVSFAPNPTTGPATLRFNSDRQANIPISLYDLTGRTIWHKVYPASPGLNTLTIDRLQELPNGSYILQLTVNEYLTSVKITLIH